MTGTIHSADAVRALIQAACLEEGSQKAWAARHGVSTGYLSSVLSGHREPGAAILAALGLARVVGYRASK